MNEALKQTIEMAIERAEQEGGKYIVEGSVSDRHYRWTIELGQTKVEICVEAL
jgi:hypothetical protein